MTRQTLDFRSHLTAITATAMLALGAHAHAQELPDTMIWTSYDVGSAGYAEASAIADAFGREYGTRVRIQPSSSAIGRIQPLVQGRANYGFLGGASFFAVEGTYDFAERRWGPQDLRAIAGRPASFGMPTAADAGIEKLEDVKGKRVAYIAGNPWINFSCDAFLAFAGLDRDDVEAIMFPSYKAAIGSLAEGKADAACTTTTPSQLYELEQSPRGIHWVPIPSDDEQGWQRLTQMAPIYEPNEETVGAGISQDTPVELAAYRYPVLGTRADTSAEEVYALTKALDETYDLYKDATDRISSWSLDKAGTPPIELPFHEGAIRYLKEKGIWTDEMQAWNDARLKRLEALKTAWSQAIAEGEGKSDEEFATIWERQRTQALDSL
ncbi:TAXI family TRAP transporter solute-binding subunit [Halomonas shantousis]